MSKAPSKSYNLITLSVYVLKKIKIKKDFFHKSIINLNENAHV